MPPSPLVLLLLPPEGGPLGLWKPQPATALPMTATALPHTVTGAFAYGLTWLPDRIPPSPLVRLLFGGAPEPPVSQPAAASPITDTALPQTVTGALTYGLTWLPERIPPSPLVRLLLDGPPEPCDSQWADD